MNHETPVGTDLDVAAAAALDRSPRQGRGSRRATLDNGQQAPNGGEKLLIGVILTICSAAVLIPFLGIISTSLSTSEHLNQAGGFTLWPDGFHIGAYVSILTGGVVTRALLVSIGVTTVGTLLSLTVSSMMAFGLSRPGSLLHKPILLVLLFSLLFSPGLIPLYLTVKQVGLLNSYWSLILPGLISAFNVSGHIREPVVDRAQIHAVLATATD